MSMEKVSREDNLNLFRDDVLKLSRYLPWLEEKSGKNVTNKYSEGDELKHTLAFPVYDSVLMSFLNEAGGTAFIDKNYRYIYARKNIRTTQDELKLIAQADIMHMDILQGIFSHYVVGGMTKAYLWKEGVQNGIFYEVVKKARQIIEFWEQPLVVEDEIYAEDAETIEETEVAEEL